MHKQTRVIYASSAMREEDFTELFRTSTKMPGQQAQKFNRLMIKGFGKNGVDVFAISAPPINKSNCPAVVKFLGKRREGNVCYRYLPIWNIKTIKNLVVMLSSFWSTFWAMLGRKAVVVCDVLNISVSTGAVFAGRLLGKRCVGIVTDIPELMVTGSTPKMLKYCYKVIQKCTDYVFLTEPMNERLNVKNKPHIVLEGHADEAMCFVDNSLENKAEKNICMYAGSLMRIYGVKNLVDGFVMADIPNTELHIYGSGDYDKELQELVAQCETVKYFGVVPNSEIVEAELRATLLINPRPTNEEYTKYSFPSKNMEYMASGTPVLTTKLPGMPDEYLPYVFLVEDETAEGIKQALLGVFSNSREQLHDFGAEAKIFVLKEKNNRAQARKVLALIGSVAK